jgi:hypothetical protein
MTSSPVLHSIGALMTGADWAIAHGDIDGLAHVMRELSVRIAGPLGAEMIEIDTLCSRDPERACARWCRIRKRLVEDTLERSQ